MVEVFSNLLCYDGICFGYCSENVEDLFEIYQKFCIEGFGMEVKCCIMFGIFVLSVGYYDVYYVCVQKVCCFLVDEFNKIFVFYDFICLLVIFIFVWLLGESLEDFVVMYLLDIYIVVVNMVGILVISVLSGVYVSIGLLLGMQLMVFVFKEVDFFSFVD